MSQASASIVLSLDNRPESLTQAVYRAIREAIVNRSLEPGARTTEESLASALGVSKTPVREALLKLRLIGLLEADGPRGLRVVRSTPRAIHEAYQVREALETFAAFDAAGHADASWCRAIQESARRSLDAAETDDLKAFRDFDTEFHLAIHHAVNNPRLSAMIDDLMALLVPLHDRDVPVDEDDAVECARAHVDIAAAITRGDALEAPALMRTHIRSVKELVLRTIEH
jgi:DNA-binding GntR family transcriptional regulator